MPCWIASWRPSQSGPPERRAAIYVGTEQRLVRIGPLIDAKLREHHKVDTQGHAMVHRVRSRVAPGFGVGVYRLELGQASDDALGSAAQQRSEKPLLSEFDPGRGPPPRASPRLLPPPWSVSAWLYRWLYGTIGN